MQVLYHSTDGLRHRKLVRQVNYQNFKDISRANYSRPFVPVDRGQRHQFWTTVLGFVGFDALMNDKYVYPNVDPAVCSVSCAVYGLTNEAVSPSNTLSMFDL